MKSERSETPPVCLNFQKPLLNGVEWRENLPENLLHLAQWKDHSHNIPTDIVKEMGENGLMGMFIPEEYGGAGLSVLDYVVALEEICYADAGVGVIMSVNNSTGLLARMEVWK